MKQHFTESVHVNDLAFDAHIDGHVIRFDNTEGNSGPRPKAIMLNSLAICAGFDVVAILKKMKVPFTDFSIQTLGDLSESTPSVYMQIEIIFKIKTAKKNHIKVERAAELSLKKYCGVYAMLSKICPIHSKIEYL